MAEYIAVADSEGSDDAMEIPCEPDGTILLSTVQAQFPDSLGLKYRNPAGNAWRGVRLSDDVLHPPTEGWSENTTYIITLPKQDSTKRKMDDSGDQPGAKLVRTSEESSGGSSSGDMIVLGLSYSATEQEMRTYFEQFGKVELAEVKKDRMTGRSKGFGFIRFADKSVAKTVLDKTHSIAGRRAEVKMPKGKETPNKVFVGRLPQGTTEEDLKELFEQYGSLSDVYIPKPHRGFAFVTFKDPDDAATVKNTNITLKSNQLNITFAEPKQEQRRERGGGFGGGYGGGRDDFRSGYGSSFGGGSSFDPYESSYKRGGYSRW